MMKSVAPRFIKGVIQLKVYICNENCSEKRLVEESTHSKAAYIGREAWVLPNQLGIVQRDGLSDLRSDAFHTESGKPKDSCAAS